MNCNKSNTKNNKNDCINFYVVFIYFLLIASFIFSIISLSLNLISLVKNKEDEDEIIINNVIIE